MLLKNGKNVMFKEREVFRRSNLLNTFSKGVYYKLALGTFSTVKEFNAIAPSYQLERLPGS